jgi:hypothetical protein
VLGLDGSEEQKQVLIQGLKQAVASVKELEVTEKQVTPLVIPVTQANMNEVILIEVYGLFAKDERTVDVLKKLTRIIYLAAWTFLNGQTIYGTELIEVVIDPRLNRIGNEYYEYYSANPRTWTPEKMSA